MMKLPPLEYTFDNVVLGWREEAVSFAREHGYHLIVNSDQRPFHHFVGYQDVKHNWYNGIFELGMKSLLPVPFDVQTVGLENKQLKIITRGNTKVLINFKTLHVFDLENSVNVGFEEAVDNYLVYDMFDITAGSRLGRDIIIKPNDTFVKLVEFVTSNRIDRNSKGDFKDIITTSLIGVEDIKSFDYSDTVVRIFLERKFRELKIKQHNGRNLKIRHSFRRIIKNDFQIRPIVEGDELDARIIIHA